MLTSDPETPVPQRRVWPVGALCRAVADALDARFNPVAVRGEISGFSRASSGHCYFTVKDAQGQLRCAMFRRAAALLDFLPRDGELVELRGRLGVYEPRGELQLVVESLSRAGQGTLFEQFLLLKQRLESEGLFDPSRKRPLPALPRTVGIVTSLGAAALHDVVSALRRRAPHVAVVVSPAPVQGAGALAELVAALQRLYALAAPGGVAEPGRVAAPGGAAQPDPASVPGGADVPPLDVVLLVRGGGSMEDLWAFNDEQLARTVLQSPVPLVSGVGHETDFTIVDFVADLRAPTPTAAAELCAAPRDAWLADLDSLQARLSDGLVRHLDRQGQRVDAAASRLGRPSALAQQQQMRLARHAERLRYALRARLQDEQSRCAALAAGLPAAVRQVQGRRQDRLERHALRLQLLDPALVLQRGYAWLTDPQGRALTRAAQLRTGDAVRATLADGTVELTVDDAAQPRLL